MRKKTEPLSVQEAKAKAARYCAYQERTHQEVQTKLESFGLSSVDLERILGELEAEGFYNEERYAQAFCSGKLHHNKWGRVKIVQALRQKGLTEQQIQIGLAEIEEETYRNILSDLIIKKLESLKEEDTFTRNHKAARYAIGKGFESDLVWKVLGE